MNEMMRGTGESQGKHHPAQARESEPSATRASDGLGGPAVRDGLQGVLVHLARARGCALPQRAAALCRRPRIVVVT